MVEFKRYFDIPIFPEIFIKKKYSFYPGYLTEAEYRKKLAGTPAKSIQDVGINYGEHLNYLSYKKMIKDFSAASLENRRILQ